MTQMNAAPLFPETVIFPDVDAATLAREETVTRSARAFLAGRGAWQDYLRKTLPPMPPAPSQGVTLRGEIRMVSAPQAGCP